MSVYTDYQLHPNIFVNPVTANAKSITTFAQDFKTIQFSIQTDASANFDVQVIVSNSFLPPDITVAASASNMYNYVGYTDESNQVYDSSTSPYNPTGTAVNKTFNVETTGARWVFFQISNYSAGTLERLDCMLFSNFN